MRVTRASAIASIAVLVVAGAAAAQVPTNWRKMATPADRERLRGWRDAWVSALRQVQSSPAAGELRAQGVLFDPDRSLVRPVPPAGAYRCRVFKLGGVSPEAREYSVSVWDRCTIGLTDGVTAFAREEGRQRPSGTIIADTDARAIFLGTLTIGDERRAFSYGRDSGRDMAGIVERIGEARWRIALPHPKFESTLDVIELTPEGA